MKVVILAGGFGTRLGEETDIKPKPMIEIGGKPMLWHIMKYYSCYGFNEFIILLGYKGYVIKEYFANYYLHLSDVTFDLSFNQRIIHSSSSEPWKVTLVDTGLNTMTGGRIKKIENFVKNETFMLTYGDGLSNVDIKKLIEFHNSHKKIATLTSIQPEGRFGILNISSDDQVTNFIEKPLGDGSWINGGFFVCGPQIFDYINNDESVIFEKEVLEGLSRKGELYAYRHRGFWQCMDTMRDKQKLENLWTAGSAPWKLWQ